MYKHFFKRLLDILISLLTLPFVLLAIIIFGPIIFFTDRGPIFYCGKRLGKNGKPFKMVKFRSMKVNAPDLRNEDGSTFNSDNDFRVTRIGNFLRKTSIDELPQFFNVFIGQMSLIGPRPDPLDDLYVYTDEQKQKLNVRPGITGYNQAYYRNSVSQDEKFEHDVYYSKNISFWLDVKIFFKTIATVFRKEHIYNDSSSLILDEQKKTSSDDCCKNDSKPKVKKKIMILGASVLQLPAIKKALEMNLDVVVVDMNPNAIGFRENGIEKEIISTTDIPKVIEAAKKHKIDGVLTLASDMPMRTVSAVAEEMKLIGIDKQTALRATNKYEMRKALEKAGVPIPLYFKVSSKEEVINVINCFDGKFLTKPADNSGSRGICLVEEKNKAIEAFQYSKSNSRNGDVVIEEFMEGPEVSVETLTIDGVCNVIQITDKLTTGSPHFVEIGHSQPSQLSAKIQSQIKEVAIIANKAIGIENGPSHTEIIVTKDGPKIVELGARLGGDCITTHLVPLSTGFDIVKACIEIALGEKPIIPKSINRGSAIRYFPQHEGVINHVEGVERAMRKKCVKQISVVKNIGDRIGDIVDSGSRIGFLICDGKDANNAVKNCENAMRSIKIDIISK